MILDLVNVEGQTGSKYVGATGDCDCVHLVGASRGALSGCDGGASQGWPGCHHWLALWGYVECSP